MRRQQPWYDVVQRVRSPYPNCCTVQHLAEECWHALYWLKMEDEEDEQIAILACALCNIN